MGCLVYLSLVTLLSCGIQGASLPYKNGYEYHFNEMGVRLDLAMKDVNPLVGGKAHIELPVSAVWKMLEKDAPLYEPVIDVVEKATLPVWKLLEVEAPYLKPLLIALEKHTVGKLYDVMTVKADITFNAEKVLHGIFNVAVDYTIVHRDGTEEKATLLIQGKNQAGKIVTSLEIIPKTDVDMTKKIFYPLEMIFTCDWPSAHTLTIKGDFGKIFLKIANDMNEVSVRGILEYLGQQYKYTTVLSIKEKMFTATFQEPTKEPFDFVMKFKMWKGYPRIEMIGTLPTSPYFTAGVFKTEIIVNNWLNYELKHIFNDVEMLNLTFKMLKGLPRLEITGTMPTSRYFTAGVFKTEVIVKNMLNYRIKHVFNGVEMLNLTFKMLKGLPILEITGTMPNTRFFTAGAFKTEVIVNNMLNYEFKHIFNGKEMLNLTFKMLKGLPRLEITGTMPTSRYFTAGVFKTEVIVNNLLNYDLKHIFNGMEMLSMEFKMLNGFPRLQITGTMPSSRFFAPGVFKTDVIVNNWLNFDIKHIFNDMEMLSLTLKELNGFPRLEITGTMLALQPILPAGVFKTEVIVNNWFNYEIKHVFNNMEMLNIVFKMLNGFPRLVITGTMPTLPLVPTGAFKTEVIVSNWLNYDIKHIFNGMEMLNFTFKMLNGFPTIEVKGTMPTLPLLPAGVFKTEVIVSDWVDYEIKHIFNDKEMLSMTLKMLKGFPRLEITGTMPTLPLLPVGVFKTEVIANNWLNYEIKHIFDDMEMLNIVFKMLNGFPRLVITGTMPTLPLVPVGAFKTEVIVSNWLNYDIKHFFNDVEMLSLTLKELTGFPRLEITGTMPTLPILPAGVFKTEVIVNNWFNYEIKHIFNDMEMLNMIFKMLHGYPRLAITGTMPTLPLVPAGVFKTEVIVSNWLNYDIKHFFNDFEMLSLTLKELTGFPRLEITGTMPTLPILPAGVFKTEVTVNNWFDFEMKHIFNKMEMLNIVFKMLNGLPMLEITGTMPTLPLLPAGVFKTEVIGSSRYSYEIKHIFNGMELLNLNYKMMNGFPRLEITGTMPTLPILPAGVFKTEVIVNNWVDYEIKHIFNDMEMLNIVFKMLNGFPKLAITGTMPTVPFLPAGVFKTEVIANSRFNYEIKHIFNEMEMLKITVKMVKGFPRIEIAGKMPTLPIIPTGAFKTEIIAKSWKNYEIRHIFNGMQMLNLKIAIINGKMEMIGKYGMTHKTHLVMEYEYMRWVKIMLPTTNTWLSKELGIEMHYQPTNEAKLLEGGNIKIVAMHDNMPLMEIAGYFGLTWDSTVYEILVKDFHINLMNLETILPFEIILPEVKFYGKIFLDRQNRNGWLPKLAFEAQIHKDEKIVFHYLLTTVETPYKLHIFFPYFFQHVLHLTHEHLEITHEHIVLGNKQVIKTLCNLTAKKLIGTITPTLMSFELFDGELSLVKYVTELTKIEVGRNAMVLEGVKTFEFNAYQPMLLPKILGFNKLITKFHLEVADKAAGKVNINVAVSKDTTELVKVVVNNVEAPYMIVLEAPVLALEMKYDYELTTKVGNLMINDKTYMMVKPTVANEAEVIVFGFPVVKVALRADEVKITTIIPKLPEIEVAFLTNGIKITAIIPDLPEIAAAVTLKTFSLFQNTLGIQILVGKMSHKTLFGWNFNMLKKAFVDVKLIGSGIELLGDYEVFHHLNWNIVGLENIDVEWTGKVLCPGVKLFKTPMVTEGKLLFKNFVLDIKMVEKLMDVPYTLIVKTKPLTVALLPFFHYP